MCTGTGAQMHAFACPPQRTTCCALWSAHGVEATHRSKRGAHQVRRSVVGIVSGARPPSACRAGSPAAPLGPPLPPTQACLRLWRLDAEGLPLHASYTRRAGWGGGYGERHPMLDPLPAQVGATSAQTRPELGPQRIQHRSTRTTPSRWVSQKRRPGATGIDMAGSRLTSLVLGRTVGATGTIRCSGAE